MHAVFMALKHLRDTFMLMGPDNQMEEFRDHALSDRVASRDTKMHAFVFVLMQN